MRFIGLLILLVVVLMPMSAGAQNKKFCDYTDGGILQGNDIFLISRNCGGTYKLSAISIADYVLAQTPGVNGEIFFRSGGLMATASPSEIRSMLGLHAVAVSGAYSDLTGRPSFAAVASSGQYSDLAGAPVLAAVAQSGAYADLIGKPILGTMAAAATADYYTSVSTDSLLSGKANSSHTHAISNVTGLQTALDGKAAAAHTHVIADTTGLQAAIDGKAASVHGHAVSDISGLQASLDSKVSAGTVPATFGVTFGGAPITTGSKGYIVIPADMTVTGWSIVGDQSGSIVIDVKRATYSAFPTTTSIAGSEKPTLSAAQKNRDLALSTWTTSLNSGDVIEFVVESVSGVERINLVAHGVR